MNPVGGETYRLQRNTREFCGDDGTVCSSWWLHDYTYVKSYQTVYLKMVNFIVCKFYLNKGNDNNTSWIFLKREKSIQIIFHSCRTRWSSKKGAWSLDHSQAEEVGVLRGTRQKSRCSWAPGHRFWKQQELPFRDLLRVIFQLKLMWTKGEILLRRQDSGSE